MRAAVVWLLAWAYRFRWWINRRRFPDQAYFWTPEWQRFELEAEADYAAGRYVTFENEAALMSWLTEADEEQR